MRRDLRVAAGFESVRARARANKTGRKLFSAIVGTEKYDLSTPTTVRFFLFSPSLVLMSINIV